MERKPAGKKYNDEFKKTIVDLYHAGNSVEELNSEYGVSEVTFYKWMKEFTPISSDKGSLTPKELADLQKENLRLKQELEILKKAMAILKKKEVYHTPYTDYPAAKLAMFQFIEGRYNRNSIHSSLSHQTPQAIEDQIRKTA